MEAFSSASEEMLTVLQVIGTIAFAISGALAAARRNMDFFGVIVLGVIVAVGGGSTRDMLIGATPVFWVASPWYIVVAAVTALATIPLARRSLLTTTSHYVLIADAAGLAVFVVSGTATALQYTTGSNDLANGFVAVILGVVTGIVGGMFRDILANRVPTVLVGGFYATAAFIGATVYVLLLRTPLDRRLVVWIPVLLIFGLRMVAIKRNWSLPDADVSALDSTS